MKLFKLLTISFLTTLILNSCQDEIMDALDPLQPPVANAGGPYAVALPVNFDTLRGSERSFNGPVTGRLWSLISGPNVPVLHSPAAAVTRVSNLIEGLYKFQYMVIDSAGLTGVDTTSLTVPASPVQTLNLQPANNPGDAHIQVINGVDAANGDAPEISAAEWTNGGLPMTIRGLLKFNLAGIPASATILSAKLTLYSNPTPMNGDHTNANSGSDNAFYIGRATSNWAQPATWFGQPSMDISSAVLIPHTSANFLDVTDINVTALVQAMVSTNNYGFKLQLKNEVAYNIRNFCSSKHAQTAKHPKIVITYQ